MSKFTLDLKLAAPVVCTDCDWLGQMGALRTRGTDPAGTAPHCPKCKSQRIKPIESPAPEMLQ